MTWWKPLKGLIKGKFSKNKLLSGFKIGSDNTVAQHVTHVNKQIVFNLPKFDKEGQQILQDTIKGILAKNDELIGENSSEAIQGLISQEKSSSEEILNYFRTRVSPDILGLIRSAYYIKSFHDKNDRKVVTMLKAQLGQRYGKRAYHLTNLCNEEYFDVDIVPYLKKLEQEGLLQKDDFEEMFLDLVDNFPTAVFISSRMTLEEIEEEIKKQMEQNKKSDIDYLTIHGINKENVNSIEKVIYAIESEGNILGKETVKKGDIVKITIRI